MQLLWSICFFGNIITKPQYIYSSPLQHLAVIGMYGNVQRNIHVQGRREVLMRSEIHSLLQI